VVVAVVVLGAWAYYGGRPAPPAGKAGADLPDLLLVTIDTLRADRLGCYGSDVQTPVIDGLAAGGVRFEASVAHVPLTLPSHASILTGQTPLRHGVRDNAGFVLSPGTPTLAGWLGAAGYQPAAFVSAFPVHSRFGLAQGFTTYDDRFPRGDDPARPAHVERRGDATIAAAVSWLRDRGAGGSPLFVWVHLFDPHAPYEPPEPFASRFRDRAYEGEVAFADSQVGLLLEGWRQARGRDPVVVVTSDHGEGLGEHGEPTHGLFIYDSTIRVPLVIAGPGIPAGRVPKSLARGIDIAPTLLDLAGVRAPGSVEGRSLRPLWEGRSGREEPAYVESLFGRLGFGWAPLHGLRERDLMFIDAPRPEIYDLRADPGQARNLAADRVEDLARMKRAVQAALAKAPEAKPVAIPRAAREQLRSLGYVASGTAGTASLRDPKDFAALAVRIENAMAVERADPARAASEFRAALGEDPDNRVARRHLAMALVAGRQYVAAERELRTLLAAGDDSLEAVTLLGDCYRLSGRYAEALEAFDRAVTLDPSAPEGFGGRGKTLTVLGRHEEARLAFGQALRVAPDDPEALEGLADLALARGDLAEARLRLDALAARDPGDARVALKYGVVLVRTGEIDRAISVFRAVTEREPANAEAAVNLGGALAKSGRPAEALPYFERAVRAGAKGTALWNGLAMARLETGNREGAAAALRESLRANPNQPQIRELLARVRYSGAQVR
jgi:arylsulfatase A-like enzyme/Flp pilus assembly protein TadD